MSKILNHVTVTSDTPPDRWLYVLHGIFGSGRNWGSLARRFTETHPHWGVVLVDQRLHGDSTDFQPPHTVRASAEDVARLEAELDDSPAAILGHSFGGKVALMRAKLHSDDLQQIWAVDSPLEVREPSGGAWEVLQVVKSLPDRYESRAELVAALENHGYAAALGQWLAMNLERSDDGFRWRLDWEGVEEMLRDYHATDVWDVVEDPPGALDIHFVRATRSDAVGRETLERLREAAERSHRVHLHEVEGSHWINVDNPEGVRNLLERHLPD